jgi:hypothetical protein
MKRLCLLLIFLLATLVWAQQGFHYSNARYGYSIDFPEGFVASDEAPNGDGCVIESADGVARVLIYGSNNIDETSISRAYGQAIAELPVKPAYKARGKSWFIISWLEGATIHYRKTFHGNGSSNTFWLQYPAGSKKRYDQVATKLEKSFQPGDLTRPH